MRANREDAVAPDGRRDASSLGEFVVRRGLVDDSGLERAMRLSQGSGERLNNILTRLGLVSERDMATAMAEFLDLPLLSADGFPETPVLEDRGSANFLKEARIIPIADMPDTLVLAMADPFDEFAIKAMQLLANKPVSPQVAAPEDIERAIERAYDAGKSVLGQIVDQSGLLDDESTDEDVERLKDLASEAPVIRMVNQIIAKAVEARASDIHIEPFENRLRVRYRVDGVLHETDTPPSRFRAAIISRIKIMARLNIAERRLPQDGRAKLTIRGNEIDLRISTVPTMHGESVNLRILDRGSVELDFASLGFGAAFLKTFLDVLQRPNGILLVTGPTGSGKTTSLYAALLSLNTPDRNILTVEDPIEYQLDGVNQIQVKPQIDLTFANLLRSLLRHDPDVLMIGEIRDLETAGIAIQAALTGHLVLSTLHTNDAASTVTRLLDMGVEDYLLTATVNGIVAQRLLRTLCPDCRAPHEALPELVEQMRLHRFAPDGPITLYKPIGCKLCSGSGYLGRTSILEMLVMSDPIRQLILKHTDVNELRELASRQGMKTMYQDGVEKALAGITTLDEVVRVTRDA